VAIAIESLVLRLMAGPLLTVVDELFASGRCREQPLFVKQRLPI